MSLLTQAITSHDRVKIEAILAAHPEMASERVNGWLPIEWAERSSNLFTFVRAARLLGQGSTPPEARERLRKFVTVVCTTEYEAIPPDKIPAMVWACLYEGKSYTVDRLGRRLIAGRREEEDLRFLCTQAGITSFEQFREVLNDLPKISPESMRP
ncbi:hypothetical protein [Roseimicrobium sp. ORNL1]|uniref:hypothetical protein n=1 Tax=Roseimicrobium sp. ORNL1 TaxID=2711231 RepID=UPI0013E1FD1E|nr:hypothetical protein [Roseimicrobium sp. ORNL1]QIF03206.1 hypothetical protein G5S37_17310 [Roseimicrobium sp. ORNL1]